MMINAYLIDIKDVWSKDRFFGSEDNVCIVLWGFDVCLRWTSSISKKWCSIMSYAWWTSCRFIYVVSWFLHCLLFLLSFGGVTDYYDVVWWECPLIHRFDEINDHSMPVVLANIPFFIAHNSILYYSVCKCFICIWTWFIYIYTWQNLYNTFKHNLYTTFTYPLHNLYHGQPPNVFPFHLQFCPGSGEVAEMIGYAYAVWLGRGIWGGKIRWDELVYVPWLVHLSSSWYNFDRWFSSGI